MKNLKLLASLGLSIAINLTKFAELVLAHTINSLQGNSEPYAWTTECGNYLS